jgi:hypothetical protein
MFSQGCKFTTPLAKKKEKCQGMQLADHMVSHQPPDGFRSSCHFEFPPAVNESPAASCPHQTLVLSGLWLVK